MIHARRVAPLTLLAFVLFAAACDSGGAELQLPDIKGHWESETFVQQDSRGSPIGNAVMEVTLRQRESDVLGEGILHMPQARLDIPFTVEGTISEQSVEFRTLFERAAPETVRCSIESEAHLKCLKGTIRFNMNRQ